MLFWQNKQHFENAWQTRAQHIEWKCKNSQLKTDTQMDETSE